jgi:hypothetical protein
MDKELLDAFAQWQNEVSEKVSGEVSKLQDAAWKFYFNIGHLPALKDDRADLLRDAVNTLLSLDTRDHAPRPHGRV